MVEDNVRGKTFSPGTKASGGRKTYNSVVYSGEEHSLESFGRLVITAGDDGEMAFIVDDRKITGEQFMLLLSQYEGWTLKYEIESV